MLDLSSPFVQVKIQREAGFSGKFKLYVTTQTGETVLRVCKIESLDIDLPEEVRGQVRMQIAAPLNADMPFPLEPERK